jgi:hypothetical protein
MSHETAFYRRKVSPRGAGTPARRADTLVSAGQLSSPGATLKIRLMETFRVTMEEFKVLGKELVDKVGEMIHAGNIRRIIIRDDHGHTFMEIPLTVAAIGVVAAPVLAAVGAIAAHLADFTIVVERVQPQPPAEPPAPPPPPGETSI